MPRHRFKTNGRARVSSVVDRWRLRYIVLLMPLSATTLTVEDWFNQPDESPSSELMDGELFMAPPSDIFHQDIAGNIFSPIRSYLRDHPVGKVLVAPVGVVLDEGTALQPDVLFVSNQKRHLVTTRAVEGGPDLVVEILSPSTSRRDRGAKKQKYALHGVVEYWLVDPKKRAVEIFYLQDDPEQAALVRTAGANFTSPLFPGLSFTVEEIFAA